MGGSGPVFVCMYFTVYLKFSCIGTLIQKIIIILTKIVIKALTDYNSIFW
jgi:hypothetical protein